MSTALTMTMAAAPSAASPPPTAQCCPQCGFDLLLRRAGDATTAAALLDAQRQIDDLQAQVGRLNEKAAAAVDRYADYEDELARLRTAVETERRGRRQSSQSRAGSRARSGTPPAQRPMTPMTPSASTTSAATRLTSLLSPGGQQQQQQQQQQQRATSSTAKPASGSRARSATRSPPPPLPPLPLIATATAARSKSAGNSTPPMTPTASTAPGAAASATADLVAALTREQSLRKAAEGRLDATSREVEELSATLFEQANEMVAAERRARARLEERVELLERRDVEKRARLEKLEGAMGRIERVRRLLGETAAAAAAAAEGGVVREL